MKKDTAISIRVDADLKARSEQVMAEYGLNMTTTVNMLLHQIVREHAIPLSLSSNPDKKLRDELIFAQIERMAGKKGLSGDEIADMMDAVIAEAESGQK